MNFGLVSLTEAQAAWDPTTGRQIEIGVKQSLFGGRGEWTFAAYDIVKQNLSRLIPISPTSSVKSGQQSSRGVELSVAMQLTDTVRYEGNVALLEGRVRRVHQRGQQLLRQTTKRTSRNRPQQLAQLGIYAAIGKPALAFSGLVRLYNNDANTLKRPLPQSSISGLDYTLTSAAWSRCCGIQCLRRGLRIRRQQHDVAVGAAALGRAQLSDQVLT